MQPFSPWTPGYQERLYEIYREYRERDPVHWCPQPDPGVWYVFDYAGASFVLKDPRFVREYASVYPESRAEGSGQAVAPPDPPATFWQMASQWMLFRDPPDHTRLRRLVNKAFVPRVVEGLSSRIEQIARELLRPALQEGGMDLIAGYAFPLPVIVIAELLGVPAADRWKFRTWSGAMVAAMDEYVDEEVAERASAATGQIWEYLKHIISERRRDPGDDLLSALIRARESGDRLSEQELVAMAVLLLVAGHETTVNLIGNGAYALLQYPDQLALLRRESQRAPQAVEELLRYDAPVQMTSRLAAADVPLGEKLIRRGQEVRVMIGAANRDPKVNPFPDRLDIAREAVHHLGFGGGIHYCLGAPLARREAQIALTTLLEMAPGLRLWGEAPRYRRGVVFRGLQSLPVSLA